MAKDNDIFNPTPKIQNMNYLFEEDTSQSSYLEETHVAPPPRRRRPDSVRKVAEPQNVSDPLKVEASRKAEPRKVSELRRASETPKAEPRKAAARANRPVEALPMGEESDFFQTRAVLMNRAEPKQAEETAQKPREIEPLQVQPRKVRPKDAAPRKAQPKAASHSNTKDTDAPKKEHIKKKAPRENPKKPALKANMVGHGALTKEDALSEITLPESKAAARAEQPAARTEHAAARAPRKSQSVSASQKAASHRTSAASHRTALPDPNRVNRAAVEPSQDAYYSSRRGGGSDGKKQKGKKKSGFKKFMLVYVVILLVILIAGGILFSSFLSSLEKSQPTQIAETAAKNFAPNQVKAYLTEHKDLIKCFGDPAVVIDACVEKLQGAKKISYIENKDYRADAPSYNITADGATVAKLTLATDGKGSFGLSKWKIADLNVADYLDTASYEFLAPVGTTITIDGTELDGNFLTGEEGIPKFLQTASKYVTIPSFLTYKVAGIAGSPNIVAKDASGKEMKLTATDDKYVIGAETSKEFVDSVKPLVEGALEAWGKHFINMGGSLGSYIMEDSDWHTYIFGGPDMDPILTSLYEFESIANYEFTEKEVGNFIKYTDDCFTVDVHYKMKIDFTTDQMSDENQQLDATWVFVTKNDGQDWYIVDCIYKQSDEQN